MTKVKYSLTIALILSFLVISLGAYTRLSDSGLGCPDWPGCYGHLTVPSSTQDIQAAQLAFPDAKPVIAEKAWPEMIHRYLAGTFGLFVIGIACYHIYNNTQRTTASLLLGLIVFQATLGLWTVTLKLHPIIVVLHLLGGFLISSLLLWLLLGKKKQHTGLDKWAYFILAVILTQAFFGATTSANYSSLICPDFPFCQGVLFPELNLQEAFASLVAPFGADYEYGVLNNISRVTIHMTHRYFAIITAFGIISFLVYCYYQEACPKKILITVASILTAQILLGILNIILLLPTYIAVTHNLFGLLLLLSWIYLTHSLNNSSSKN